MANISSNWLYSHGHQGGPNLCVYFHGLVRNLESCHLVGHKTSSLEKIYRWHFFLWYGTEEELLRFIEYCNSSHETIKFTFDYNFKTRSVDFLDIHIWIDHEGWIQTDLFQKDGKKCQLLLPSSAHPGHCSRSIPYSISYRLRRLCSMVIEDESSSWMELQELRHKRIPTVPNQLPSRLEDQLRALKSRGYKHKSVLEQFQKALEISRDLALEKVIKAKKRRQIDTLPSLWQKDA